MNTRKMQYVKPILGGALLCLASLGTSAYAQTTHAVRSADQIKAQYKADMKQCDTLKGNDKEVCEKQAKANRDGALADAKMGKKKSEAEHDAVKDKRNAQYGVEMKKCDALSGDAQDKCEADAKTKYSK